MLASDLQIQAIEPGHAATQAADLPASAAAEFMRGDRPMLDAVRLLQAFALAPLVVPFYAAILFGRLSALPFGLLSAYVGVALFIVPTLHLLSRFRRAMCWHCIAAGALGGVATFLVWRYLANSTWPPMLENNDLGALALAGAITGFCVWLIGIAGESRVGFRSLVNIGL